MKGDGQSILHKAVLHKQRAVVQYLAETFVYQVHRKVDEIRDQWQRTALHYAYGHDDNDQIVNVLLDVGASEFTLDMVSTNFVSFQMPLLSFFPWGISSFAPVGCAGEYFI